MIFTLQNYKNSQIYAKKFSNLYEKILKSMRKKFSNLHEKILKSRSKSVLTIIYLLSLAFPFICFRFVLLAEWSVILKWHAAVYAVFN